MLINSLWAALFATGLCVLLTTPPRYVVPTFLGGFAGRFVRDLLIGLNITVSWSTMVASATVVLIAAATVRRHKVSPVVLISGVLPLGASVAMFNMIIGLLQIPSLKGEAVSIASAALVSNTVQVFVTSLAIALGLAIGIAIVRLLGPEEIE